MITKSLSTRFMSAKSLYNSLLIAAPVLLTGNLLHAGTKVAFIGDQGVDENAQAVLAMIAEEGTDLVLIQGDLGYLDNAAEQWEQNLTNAFGENFPVLSVAGNHEDKEWPIYHRHIRNRVWRNNGLDCTGNPGVKATCSFQNLDIAQVSPGIFEIEGIDPQDDYSGYIDSFFASSNKRWKICSWHKNQNAMQTGTKIDATGWGVYNACLNTGALVATAHEHVYSRTYLMSSFENQTVAHRDPTMTLEPGRSFAFVSGMGGFDVRDQDQGGDWWASIYTSTQGATHGALFCDFEDTTASCYFKAVNGAEPDRFELRSYMGAGDGSSNTSISDNSENTEAAPAATSVVSAENSSADAVATLALPVESNGIPRQPQNLRGSVYSPTALEVFWERGAPGSRYRVAMNGQIVSTIDGKSFYFDGLQSGGRYVIDVMTIGPNNLVSPGSTVVLWTP